MLGAYVAAVDHSLPTTPPNPSSDPSLKELSSCVGVCGIAADSMAESLRLAVSGLQLSMSVLTLAPAHLAIHVDTLDVVYCYFG